MQHRQYKVTTWPFKGKWNWNVTEWKDSNESNVLVKGNGCKSSWYRPKYSPERFLLYYITNPIVVISG